MAFLLLFAVLISLNCFCFSANQSATNPVCHTNGQYAGGRHPRSPATLGKVRATRTACLVSQTEVMMVDGDVRSLVDRRLSSSLMKPVPSFLSPARFLFLKQASARWSPSSPDIAVAQTERHGPAETRSPPAFLFWRRAPMFRTAPALARMTK